MKTFHSFPPSSRRDHGVALVITLLFIVIITILVVGLLDSSRVERAAAGSHYDRLRAATAARDGVEIAIATLHRETADPSRKSAETDDAYNKRKRNWISHPGLLIVPNAPNLSNPNDPLADQKQLRREVALSTGTPSAAFLAKTNLEFILRPPNLNVRTLVEQNPVTYLLNDRREKDPTTGVESPFEMLLRWVYVRQDGSYELTGDGTAREPTIDGITFNNKTNPIVARFAYWVDDESSKVNYNLAWKRAPGSSPTANPNLSQEAHPSRINLMGLTLANGSPLTEPMADAIHNWTTKSPGRYFNSFADGRQVSDEVSRMLDYNKFELTHYNHDPDTTFFGEDRIMLTMNRDLVPKVYNPDGTVAKNPDGTTKYARKFLDILRDDISVSTLDPGILEHIAGGQPDWVADPSGKTLLPNKLDPAVRNVMRYVSEKNWPLSPGVSFKDKYYPGTSDTSARMGQIAINIIDYVRAKESPTQTIAPLRFAVGPANAVGDNKNKFTLHPDYTYGVDNSYQGICRAPYITEAAAWMEKDPTKPPAGGWPMLDPDDTNRTKPLYKCIFKGELFLPPNYGFPKDGIELVPDRASIPATGSYGWFFTWTETKDSTPIYYGTNAAGKMGNMELPNPKKTPNKRVFGNNALRILKSDLTGGQGSFGTSLIPGSYITVTKTFYRNIDSSNLKLDHMRMVLFWGSQDDWGFLSGDRNRWPRVNIGTQTGQIPYSIGLSTTSTVNNMPSIEVDDPRCNIHLKDWTYNPKGNTFGKANSKKTQ